MGPSLASLSATPANNTSYVLNQLVVADYACTDATSGILSCSGPVADGSNVATSAAGSFSFKVDAEDIAGNTATATNSYAVGFAICPLYDHLKAHRAGSTVPIKLQLCDASGLNVSSSSIVLQAVSLSKLDGTATGLVDEAGQSNSPDNNFRYDSELEGYIFNLSTKTPSPALGQTTSLASGTWKLCFKVDDASSTGYCVTFDVK